MKKRLAYAVALALAACWAFAQDFQKPGVLTAIGQNSDVAVAHAALNLRMKLGLAYEPMLSPLDVRSYKTVVLVVGASAKGMGAAGVTLEDEIARAKAIVAQAAASGSRIILAHLGGANRRGPSSNALIEICAAAADAVVVMSGGNEDKFFDGLAAKRPGIPFKDAPTVIGSAQEIFALFAK